MRNQNITGIILAGGKSSRMGRNKAFIEINGEISIRTLHNLIKPCCSEVIISANFSDPYQFLHERIIADEIPDIGPIGGIISCLKKSYSRKNLVIACDMPMVPFSLVQLLISHQNSAEFVVPANGTDVIEPLCAVYDKSVIPALSEMISKGDYKMQNLINHCKTALIQVHNGNNIFLNLNTPEDLRRK